MTTVVVNSGACGYSVTIRVEKNADGKMSVSVDTDCEMIRKMSEDIRVLERFAPLTGLMSSPVYRSASKHIKHVACVVPSGILKALEVEAGLNVAKDASIVFIKKRNR